MLSKLVHDSLQQARHPASYWLATAQPAPRVPSLTRDLATDVVVIGAGYTGLSAAWHLQQAGIPCVIVDANDIGWGASGRNGGMLPPRYKKGFAALTAVYGHEVTRRLHRLVLQAVDIVEDIVSEAHIECDFKRTGQLTAALGPNHLARLAADAEWAASEAGDNVPRILDPEKTRAEIGGGRYVGGWLDVRGASLHPLAYARGLAQAILTRGVPIHGTTPVLSLQEVGNEVIAATPGGTIRAKQAVLATNAYTDLYPCAPGQIERRIVPVTSSLIATSPLGSNLAQTVLPGGRMVVDSRHLMFYYRLQADGTLLFGGRGDITGRRDDPAVYQGLEMGLAQTFPQLKDVSIKYRWSGKVAVTLDDFPHIGRLTPRIAYAMGYGGRGVALSHLMGSFLAKMMQGISIDAGPMGGSAFGPIPFHAFRVPGMKIVAGWYRLKDAREEAAAEVGTSKENCDAIE